VTTGEAADAMVSLKQAGTKISEISDTVTEIAFQTNILALNASVEAARAGEHGRGFAVVAAEVRTLAQRTGVAAREISNLIKDSLQRIARGVDLVSRSSQEMSRIVDGSRESTALVSNINNAAQEQASGIAQVTQAVLQLNGIVQANSAQSEEMSAAADSLMAQAEELSRAVALISGGNLQLELRLTKASPEQLTAAAAPKVPGKQRLESQPIHSKPQSSDYASF
jgi:methyl-accepting chemotaxis protein